MDTEGQHVIPGGLLTVRQVAAELGMSVRAVHHRIGRGDIKAHKVGNGIRSPLLIHPDEVARYRQAVAAS